MTLSRPAEGTAGPGSHPGLGSARARPRSGQRHPQLGTENSTVRAGGEGTPGQGHRGRDTGGIIRDGQGWALRDDHGWSGTLRDGHSGMSRNAQGYSRMDRDVQGWTLRDARERSGMFRDSQGRSHPPSPAPLPPALPPTNEEQSQEALINHSPPVPGWLLRMPGASWSSQTQFAAVGGTEMAAREAGGASGSPRDCPRKGRWPPAA